MTHLEWTTGLVETRCDADALTADGDPARSAAHIKGDSSGSLKRMRDLNMTAFPRSPARVRPASPDPGRAPDVVRFIGGSWVSLRSRPERIQG